MKPPASLSAGTPCPVAPARLLANARLLPKRPDMLPLLPKVGTCADIGVAPGGCAATIPQVRAPARFIDIDIFTIHQLRMTRGKPADIAITGMTHEGCSRDRFRHATAAGRMRVTAGGSLRALRQLDDWCIGIADGDAGHTHVSRCSAASVPDRPGRAQRRYDGQCGAHRI